MTRNFTEPFILPQCCPILLTQVISHTLGSYFEVTDAFGATQWAFRKGHSVAGLTTLMVCKWILALTRGSNVGIHLSDISGAFDRVDTGLLLNKISKLGIPPTWIDCLASYLEARTESVIMRFQNRRHGVSGNCLRPLAL